MSIRADRIGQWSLAAVAALSIGAASCTANVAAADRKLTSQEQQAVDVAKPALGDIAAARDLRVLSVEPKQWPDSSLGCPQRGMSYLQVITDGYVVTFGAEGKTHEVHVAGHNAVRCPLQITGGVRAPLRGQRVTNLAEMEKEAILDLARRLGVPEQDVRIVHRTEQRWADETLGCASASAAATTGPVAGFRLTLEHRGRQYTYHTDMARVMPCPPLESR